MSRQPKAGKALAMPIASTDLPSFTDLFGPTEKAEGQTARSVLSPAAYLVDLLQLRDSILPPATDPDGYHARRPDVGGIPLDEIRTFGEVAHLELSNAIMKTLAERDTPGDVRARLAAAIFPAPLPFSVDHARLELCLPKLGTDASELYRATQTTIEQPSGDGLELARLRLGLNEAEAALFTTRRDSDAGILELWGLGGEAERQVLLSGELPLVQRKLELSLKELKALLFQNLSDDEVESGQAASFFLNQGSGPAGSYLLLHVVPPPDELPDTIDPPDQVRRSGGGAWDHRQIDRVMRFVRLARRTGLSFADLDTILISTRSAELDGRALQAVAIALELQRKLGLAIDEVCALWSAPKQHGHGDGAQAADLFDRTFNRGYGVKIEELLVPSFVPSFVPALAPARAPSLAPALAVALDEALTNRLLATLRISRADYELLLQALADRGTTAAPTLAYVSLLYRMVALSRALALTTGELVVLLDVLDAQWLTAAHEELTITIPIGDATAAPARPTFHALAHPDGDAAAVTATLLVLQRILRLKEWADLRQISARQLAFLCLERFDDGAPVDGLAPDLAVEDALTELHQALSAMLVSPAELQTGSLSTRGAAAVFEALRAAGVLAVVADAATPLPRALVRVQPLADELAAAMAAGVDERLEVYASDLAAAGVPAEQLASTQALLIGRGYLEPAGDELRVGRGTRSFFLDRANLPHFFLPELPDQREAVFAALAEKVAAHARAQAALEVEAAELAARLLTLVEQQQRAMQRILSSQLGLADDVLGLLFALVFGTADESATQTLANLTLPLFQIKASGAPRALAHAFFALGFRRLRQLGLLLTKVGFAADEAQAYFENQRLRFERPEGLKLPEGFFAAGQPVRIDALLPAPLPSNDHLLISGAKHAVFSAADYRLLGTGDLSTLPGLALPAAFLGGIDAAWRDSDGTTYVTAGDSYVSTAAPGAVRRIADTWGVVRNRLQQEQRIDAALQDDRGRVFLFRGDQYLRYSDPQRVGSAGAFADEGYPKTIAGSFEAEQVAPLPGVMSKQLDAAFLDHDGTYTFFSGNRFAHSASPFELRDIRGRWGVVVNHLFDDDRVDAAFVHGDHTYLLRRDQLVRYTGAAYGFSDEGWPVSFGNVAETDALLRVLRRFPQGIEAAMTGRDSALYVFKSGVYASSAAPDVQSPIRERWGRVRNHFVEAARVDAALFHGGKTFLFSGDQYVRYSSPGGATGYQYVDEGYPKRVRANWNTVEGIGRIPDQLAEPITASATGTSDEVYFFAGTQVAAPEGTLTTIRDQWGKVRNNLERLGRVDAALADAAGKLYLFTGDQLHRYTSPTQEFADEGFPRRLTTGWPQEGAGWALPPAFASGVSAALRGADGRIFFFSGQQYARVDAAASPSAISPHWGAVRNNVVTDSRVDAAFRDPQGKTYVFRGDQFTRYSTAALDFADEGYPLTIGARWGNLPAAFRSGIDEALYWLVDGVQRLYLFKGPDYVRYSTSDLTQIDAGYPKRIEDGDDFEGEWFRGLAFEDANESHDDDDVGIHAIYVDTYRSQPRINLFYRRDNESGQWQREYRFESNNRYRWTDHRRMESISDYAPFTQLDAALVAQDGTLHVFSGDKYASRPPAGGPLSTPIFARERWGKVRNRFAELGRVDATLAMPDGRTYLFTDTQFTRYTGALRPGEATFFSDEGYPRTTATQFAAEGITVVPPAVAQAEGSALCRDGSGRIHVFQGAQYTYGGNVAAPVAIATRWGKIDNRLQQLSRVDAALRADNGKLYLFCDDQLTRYSGALTPGAADFTSDEGYPKKIATGWAAEGLAVALPARFTALGASLLRDAQDTFVFNGDSFTSALTPAPRPLLAHWAVVRNQLQTHNRVDAGFVLQRGADTATLLFCDDQYVRYSAATDGFVDEGYPKRISRMAEVEGVAALPAAFLAPGVRAAFAGRDGALHFFTQAAVAGQAQAYVCTSDLGAVLAPKQKWGIVENRLFDDDFVDAALRPAGGALYLFSGDQYVRYTDSQHAFVDETYPRKVVPSWASELGATALPPVMARGLDAALAIGATQFYFIEDQVVDSRELATPRPLTERWGRVDNRTQQLSKIDAGFVAPSGKLVLFTGDQVAMYSGADRTYVDEGYPKVLATSLAPEWPAAFQRDLDSAATFEGRAYLFKGASHLRLSDPRLRTPDRDYPRPITDKLVDRRDFTLTGLPDAWGFKQLADDHASPPLSFLQYLAGAEGGLAPTVEQLAAMSRWSAAEIRHLIGAPPLAPLAALAPPLPGSGLGDSRTLAALARRFAYAERLGATPSSLTALAAKLFGPAPRQLDAAGEQAFNLVKAQTSPAEWAAVERSLREPLNAATRDALVAYLLHTRGLRDADDLYEYLLNDVQMGEEATTSPIVEAIASIQLYYHRARMNLEEVPAELDGELERWWGWMKNYRTWEANRRVFLFPENYLRPELRTIKSSAFDELEQSLLQDEITPASVAAAYTAYLESFGKVSRLRIAGGYVFRDEAGDSYVLVFGFERTEPLTYYYRRGRLPDEATEAIAWQPWQKIDITINAEKVQPVFAFNRIFLFWLEPQTTNETEFQIAGTYGGPDAPQFAKPVIKYSFLDASEEWVAPQTLRTDVRKDLRDGKRDPSWLVADLAQARLYITNPSLKSEYDPEAYIYVLVALKDMSDPLVGKLTAALDFEPRAEISSDEATRIVSSIDMRPTFPTRLGLTPSSFSRWGAHFRGVMTSPWFSFDASGGSFLCRPAEPAPIALEDLSPTIELRGLGFAEIDAGFGSADGELHVFTAQHGRKAYHRHGAPVGGGARSWQPPVFTDSELPDGTPAWPRGFLRRFFAERPADRIRSLVTSGDRTYLMTDTGSFTYSASNYRFVDQTLEISPEQPPLEVLVNHAAEVADARSMFDAGRTLVNAFVRDGLVRLITRSPGGALEYGSLPYFWLRAHVRSLGLFDLFDDWQSVDAAFLEERPSGRHVIFTYGRDVVALRWDNQSWAGGSLADYQVDEPGLSTALSGRDGVLYFFSGDRYAEITAGVAPQFRPAAERWGHFPPLYPDAAVIGLDEKLYFFAAAYCLRFSNPLADGFAWQLDAGFPQRIHDVWGTQFPVVTSAIKLGQRIFLFGERDQTKRYERYSAMPSTGIFVADATYPKALQGGWGNLPTSFNLGFDAVIGIAAGADVAAELLVARQHESLRYGGETDREIFEISEVKYSIVRLTSNTSARLSQILLGLGVPGLLSLATQKTQELPRFSTNPGDRGQAVVTCVDTTYLESYPDKPTIPPRGPALDFDSASGFYYWEIFFHIPYLIAQALNQAQRFEEARSWYEHVFDPTEKTTADGRAFWKFLPFHDATDNGSQSYLEDPDQLIRYRNDPFDPHGLAQLRPIAYRKAFVMSYIDNLLDWGDLLFQQFTRESLGEATMLYVLAAELLGKRPQETGKRVLELETLSYDELIELAPLDAALIELENELPATPAGALALTATPNDSVVSPYFFIPENQQFIDYWDRVSDRLFKIRNGLNLDGVKQALALFAPPLDPLALVRAFASGGGLAQALSDFNAAVPHYRCTYMLGKARELVGRVTQLGGALLSALEKQDAEELNLLRNTQERGILEMTLEIKQQQLAASQQSALSLRASLASARTRQTHYQRMLSEGLSAFEGLQLVTMAASQILSNAAGVTKSVQAGLSLVPNLGSFFAITFGGLQLGPAAGATSDSLSFTSNTYQLISSLASLLGGWQRRAQDWELQRSLATHDIEQITRQINAAEIQVEIARQEIQVQRQQLRNNRSIDTFMRSKFTNQQLYRWMAGKLSAVYFQTYQLALDYAKGAQRAMQFEMGWAESEAQLIGAYYWESLQKGLLAGERLQLDLDRLEKTYLDKNKRRFEITKTISLQLTDPLALLSLQQKGSCELDLSEALFDEDFPGHFCRQLKTVSVSFPAVVGPYENFNATMTQLGHRTVLRADLAAVKHLLTGEDEAPASIRADWRPTQQVALSRGVNDSGLFQLNYQDERFLPFEGTGAVSRWRLQINGTDGQLHREHLRDVIFTVQYTALPGGDDFAEKVKSALPAAPRAKIFNFAYDFPAEWQAFLMDPSRGLVLRLDRSQLPGAAQAQATGLLLHYELTDEGKSAIGRQAMRLNNSLELAPDSLRGELNLALGTWTLMPTARADRFTAANLKNIALVVGYLAKPTF